MNSESQGQYSMAQTGIADNSNEDVDSATPKAFLGVVLHRSAKGTSTAKARASLSKATASKYLSTGEVVRLGFSFFDSSKSSILVGSVVVRGDELDSVLQREISGKLLAGRELAGVVCMRDQAHIVKSALRPNLSTSISSADSSGSAASSVSGPQRAVLDTVPAARGKSDENAATILGTLFENIVASLGSNPTRQEYRIGVASVMDFSDAAQVVSCGMLIDYLKRLKLIGADGASPSAFDQTSKPQCLVRSLQPARLSEYVFTDDATLHALQVFSRDDHPVVSRGKQRSKEGVSMYSIFADRLARADSRGRLREMLKQPSCSMVTLGIRQSAVQELVDAWYTCPEAVNRLQKWMAPTSLLTTTARSFQKYDHSKQLWLRLKSAVAGSRAALEGLRAVLSNLESTPTDESGATSEQETSSTGEFIGAVITDVEECEQTMGLDRQLSVSIDWDRTAAASDRVYVATGVDDELDQLREIQESLPVELEAANRRIREEVGARLGAFELESVPQLGCLMSLPRTSIPNNTSEGYEALQSFKFILEQEDMVYFRHAETEAIDAKYGDLHQKVRDREDAVLRSLHTTIQEAVEDMMFLAAILADLDVMLAFASVAVDFNFVRPTLTNESPSSVMEYCWHPILEYIHESAIPNDVSIGGAEPAVALITGPNASGKSVYLKSVALCYYLAQIGSFVPARQATIGLASGIIACMSAPESVTSGLSSFQHELVDAGRALAMCDNRTMIVMDEFGRGTHSKDGAALLAALVRHLSESYPSARVLVATHFTEVLDERVLGMAIKLSDRAPGEHDKSGAAGAQTDGGSDMVSTEGTAKYRLYEASAAGEARIACFCMQVRFQDAPQESIGSKRARDDSRSMQDVEPLFLLARGICDGSFGIECASRAGVPWSVCLRAKQVVGQLHAADGCE